MRATTFLPSAILAAVLLAMPRLGLVADEGTQFPTSTSPESTNEVIKVSEAGLSPATLEMKREDGLVLFLNDSAESLVTLELDFGKHATHCASENLKVGDDGVIRSVAPIAPKDFATTCFHDPGTYSYTIFGLKQAPQGLKGSIIVK